MSGISNIYINNILKNYANFLGVFSSDTLPDVVYDNSGLICNLSRVGEPGTHFISIYFKNNKIYYFDSLSLDISNIYLIDYLLSFRKQIVYKRQRIQNIKSVFCGFFCMYFIIKMCYDHDYSSIFSKFKKKNLIENDKIVISELGNIFKKQIQKPT